MSRAPSRDAILNAAYDEARALAEDLTETRRKVAIRYARAGHYGLKAICKMAHCDDATLAQWLTDAGQCFDTRSEERCGTCAGCLAKAMSVAYGKVTP
jgi:hypothetical protein